MLTLQLDNKAQAQQLLNTKNTQTDSSNIDIN